MRASVGNELGPQLPEKVLSLRIRQKPPVTVRDFGLSMVADGCGAAALATKNAATTVAKNSCSRLVLVSMAFFYRLPEVAGAKGGTRTPTPCGARS
ncbi:MAG: hypothetical protein JWM08_993 [Candidatus Angelobacter sp.]|nr:hypothetical protein [Candidatus Angelobacter sp.]